MGSSRNSRSETWTVVVNLRSTSAPAIRLSTCLGLRSVTCFFGAAFFAIAFFAAAFFEVVFFGVVFFAAAFFRTVFLGAVFFPFTAAFTATSPLHNWLLG